MRIIGRNQLLKVKHDLSLSLSLSLSKLHIYLVGIEPHHLILHPILGEEEVPFEPECMVSILQK